MKKYIYNISWMIIAMLYITSCKEDLGNYNYTAINTLEIKNINSHYIVEIGSIPNIIPTLEFSKDPNFNEDNYSYEWISFSKTDVSSVNSQKLLHTGKNLEIPLTLGIGSYKIYYRVKEKSTGITWKQEFTMEVTGSIKGGWAILSEINNNSQIDYFEYDLTTGLHQKELRNFEDYFVDIEQGTRLNLSGKPKFIEGWTNTTAADNNRAKYYIYVGTENDTHKINTTDGFIWNEKYNFKFESLNSFLLPYVDFISPSAASAGFAYKDGNLYKKHHVQNINFGTPINVINGELVPLAPYIAVNRTIGTLALVLAFDTKYKRFLRTVNMQSSVLSSNLPINNANFNPNDTKMDFVWMGTTYFGGELVYAIMKDSHDYYLIRMSNGNNLFEVKYINKISHLTDISQAKLFEVDQVYGYLQYAVGGKLYQYDIDQDHVKLMQDYGQKEISLLKHNKGVHVSYTVANNANNKDKQGKRFLPVITSLICATYDPKSPNESGVVDFFQPNQFNGDFNLLYSFDKLPKVKDVTNVEVPTGY